MREKNQIGEPQAGMSQSSTTAVSPHPSSPIPHPPASRFIGRWKHRLNLHFRVWPKFKETHKAIATMKEIDVNGIRINDEGLPEIWHMTARLLELGGLDFLIAGAESMGAKHCQSKAMIRAAARALALYLDPDNAAMFGGAREEGKGKREERDKG